MKCRAASVKLRKDVPTRNQTKALQKMAAIEMDNMLSEYNRKVLIIFMHFLHFKLGFGQKRLETAMQDIGDIMSHLSGFEMDEDENEYICRKELEVKGIDVEKVLKIGE